MSWLLAFVGFAALILIHEFGHFAAAKLTGMRVERFSLFFPPTIARVRRGETEYAIGLVPLGGYVKITGMNPEEELPAEVRSRAYFAQPVWKRVVVILAGPAMNLLLAFVLMLVFFWFLGPREPARTVAAVERDYPAARELRPGDEIVAVDGRRGGAAELAEQLQAHRCPGALRPGCRAATPARVTVRRGERTFEIALRPLYDEQARRMRLGFRFSPDGPRRSLPFADSVKTAASNFWFVARETALLPLRLLDAEKRREISGVVGGYEVTRRTIVVDAADAIPIIAVISLSLAIVNLFPFLPLDGGHIFWALVEKVRRKPVRAAVMERSGAIGFALVLMLFLIGLTNDIGRLTNEGFQVR